jgi:hypothetical protein
MGTTSGDSFGGSWGDYDNDGDFDLFVTRTVFGSPATSYNSLYRNNGDGTFTTVTGDTVVTDGAYSYGSCWGDHDNDGDLDLFVANSGINFLYENIGGSFVRAEAGAITTDANDSHGAAWGDYDRDGDLDLFVTNSGGSGEDNTLYRNNGNANSWISIKCIGILSNRSAIGARVSVKATIDGSPVWQVREVSSQTGYCGQNTLDAHFGLGDAAVIDSLRVEWPSGMVDEAADIGINRFVDLTEGDYSDLDGDGVPGLLDNCPGDYNPGQADSDSDSVGDSCDVCPAYATPGNVGVLTGDVNVDGSLTAADIIYLVNYAFKSGVAPQPIAAAGDVNCDGSVVAADIIYMVNHVFKSGQPPCDVCALP